MLKQKMTSGERLLSVEAEGLLSFLVLSPSNLVDAHIYFNGVCDPVATVHTPCFNFICS